MKSKITLLLAVLLVISCIATAGLFIDNRKLVAQLQEKDSRIVELFNSLGQTSKQLGDLMEKTGAKFIIK
ncbi:MAG: hypothetical protein WC444_01110 [Candidatus Paceibacterota bacterium]